MCRGERVTRRAPPRLRNFAPARNVMGMAASRGHAGEALAAAYLELAGMRIVERNARIAGVEVDLVVEDGDTEVLVEVRFRGRTDFGGAIESLNGAKRARLHRAGVARAGHSRRVRIDVVAIELEPGGARVRHVRNAIEG
ncbi:MAG: YraN family protein [Candidatus Eisenbacteria bacterium]|uniref:UPF0102 protein HOP12_09060 n=1 Tax=Eiseniibacteriota bacterium TaxID=2212470 RepID=A0A849SKR7_UNCEI|nr:YraN family protein [Candidatus Eisenbacteria bacterium]